MIKLALILLLIALASPLPADDIVVKEIGGLPVMRTTIRYGDKTIEAHVLLDIGLPVPFIIHALALGGLELDPGTATGKKVDIEFAPNVAWKGVPMQVRETKRLQVLTAAYAQELDEIPIVAMVGLAAINSNVVELDMGRNLLRTMGLASDKAREAEFDYLEKTFGLVLPGTGPNETPIETLLALRVEDSILDNMLLTSAREAGAQPNFLEINGIKFSDHVAFRFQSPIGIAGGKVDAILGAGALRNFTVTVWPRRKKIAFLPQQEPVFPQSEQDYFFALADKNPDGMAAFIETGPRRRLMDEACRALWNTRLADPGTSTQELKSALQTTSENYDPIRSTSTLTEFADELDEGFRPDKQELAMFALDQAMKKSSLALDATDVHAIHVRLGKAALGKDDYKLARRHLLSAAFGMPKDGECNFWLAETYKELEKPRRAWSRYFQSILDPQVEAATKLKALMRLDELNRNPSFRQAFNMVEAEQYMSGRLAEGEFHAPSRYRRDFPQSPGHVQLVEFFTNATTRATGGQQLVFQSLDEYFEGDIALIEYHLNDPMHSEIASHRLEFYEAKQSLPLAVFDGKPMGVGGKKLPEMFSGLRDNCLLKKSAAPLAWNLEINMIQDGKKVSGTVATTGQGETDSLRLHVILCERSVMAVEANTVFFHHFVARQALTLPDGLDLKNSLSGASQPFEFAVDAEQMRDELTQSLDSAGVSRGVNKPSYVDPNKLIAVAFVQNSDDHRVLAAQSFHLPQEDKIQ